MPFQIDLHVYNEQDREKISRFHKGHDARNPVFLVSDKMIFKLQRLARKLKFRLYQV